MPYAREMWVEELRRFVRYLEETFQVEITDEKLFFVLDEDDTMSVVNTKEILDELELLYDLGDVPGMLDEE